MWIRQTRTSKRTNGKSQNKRSKINASIPGSFFPSRNSSDAPPPVEMCVILSANPAFSTAAAESPPPIIVVASISDNTFAIAFVPIANCGNSNSPNGKSQNKRSKINASSRHKSRKRI